MVKLREECIVLYVSITAIKLELELKVESQIRLETIEYDD